MSVFDLRATGGALSSILGRFTRQAAGGPPPMGDYSGERYAPRYTLPTGAVYNPVTGLVDYVQPVGYLPIANEVLLTDQGSVAANRNLLQTTINNAGTDTVRIRLAPVSTSWGDEIVIPGGARPGIGLYIEPASVKDGTFVRAAGNRVQLGDSGLAPFRLNPAHPFGSPPGGNQNSRRCIALDPGANKVRLVGLDCTYDPAFAATLVDRDDAVQYGLQGLISSGLATAASRVTQWQIDRCRVVGPYLKSCMRGVRIESTEDAVIRDSHIQNNFWGGQGQAVVATEGGSRTWLLNNYLASGGVACQHVLFGGGADLWNGSSYDLSRVNSDIVMVENLFDFPDQWHTDGLTTMCFLEWKLGNRVLFEANVLRGYRGVGANNSFNVFVLKEATGLTQDITIRMNRLIQCHGFAAVSGGKRQEMTQNLMLPYTGPKDGARSYATVFNETDFSKAWTRLDELTLNANTIQPMSTNDPTFAVGLFESVTSARQRWRITDNVVGVATGAGLPQWHYHTSGGSSAKVTWEAQPLIDCVHSGNVYTAAAAAGSRIATNADNELFPTNMAALAFDSNYSLTSPGLTTKGADGSLVTTATQRALTGVG